jgi:hypothetical protein
MGRYGFIEAIDYSDEKPKEEAKEVRLLYGSSFRNVSFSFR